MSESDERPRELQGEVASQGELFVHAPPIFSISPLCLFFSASFVAVIIPLW